ncbi:MAG TPA: DUF983 domain-containing protein [Caulobacteraceae bacterium]|nr:DUF983 domain-containing protein [Caulobacteraceae bacterium]
MTERTGAAPYLAGLAGRCPHCGKGPLFTGFLSVSPRCPVCGFDLAKADSGDGPAVFVIFIAGFVAAFGVMFTELFVRPPIWVEFVWLPIAAALCLGLLRPMKGLMIAAQFANRASQAGRDDL